MDNELKEGRKYLRMLRRSWSKDDELRGSSESLKEIKRGLEADDELRRSQYKVEDAPCSFEDLVKDLNDPWGSWLSGLAEWEWFVTMTLKNPQGVPTWDKPGWASAKKAWAEFNEMAQPALGSTKWVRMFETQNWRGVPHIHALVADCDPSVRRMDLVDWAYKRWGITRVLPYYKELGASYYLCKYVTKDLGDIEFSDNI